MARGLVPNPGTLAQDKFGVQKISGIMHFRVNGSDVATQALSWTPNEGEWMAETHYAGDQTAGDTNHEVEFSEVVHYNGSWQPDEPSYYYYYDSAQYGTAGWGATNYFFTWDTRYSSEG